MRAWRRIVLHRRIVLNLTDGTAIEGVLWDEQGSLLVIRGAELHENGGRVEMDGEVIIDRGRVRFAQVIT